MSGEVARDKETWKKASERTVEAVKLEATARCEGAGLDRPVEEIANLALKAGTLHPLGFTHHVKKYNSKRRKYNILIRSKVCSVCGISMNRESIPRYETTCRARRDALNPPAPVRRRITRKAAPGHVGVANRTEPMAARTKIKQKRGDTMAKSDRVRREKRRAAPDGRSFECKYCGNSFSPEKHVHSCEKAPQEVWARGVRWRAELRNKRFTVEEMGKWQHRCAHYEVSFPCRSGLTQHANECRKRKAREGLSHVLRPVLLVLFGTLLRLSPCRLSTFSCAPCVHLFFVGPHVARTSFAVPCVSSHRIRNVVRIAKAGGLLGHVSCLSARF